VEVELEALYTLFSLPHISQVYAFFRGACREEFSAGEESLEVRLFQEHEIHGTIWRFKPCAARCDFLPGSAGGNFIFRTETWADPVASGKASV